MGTFHTKTRPTVVALALACWVAGCNRARMCTSGAKPLAKSSGQRTRRPAVDATAGKGPPRPANPSARPVPAAKPAPPPLPDKGIFSDLDSKVRLQLPSWALDGPWIVVARPPKPRSPALLVLVGGAPVGFATASLLQKTPARWRIAASGKRVSDADGDGIIDALDVLIGAKKTALNGARYDARYRRIGYPGGDVPREEGVCTDVVVRAFRNAGFDLQRLVHQDILAAPRAYRMVKRPDTNIDHRRVRTILPYFERHMQRLPRDSRGGQYPLLPGDVLFLNTMGDRRPDHIGIVSDRVGASGHPLVINNWTDGHRTSEMDLLHFVPITHRYRLPGPSVGVNSEARGLDGLLRRREITIGDEHRQVLLVTTPTWTANGGWLRRFTRHRSGWRTVGRPATVRIGARGLGWGRGLHDSQRATTRRGPVKREGDRRSPAGIFELGTAFGAQDRKPFGGPWPWRTVDSQDRLVDDPRSPHYNTWQRTSGGGDWRSAEDLSVYRLALVVKHNTSPVVPGAGSAIFVHVIASDGSPSVGCTTLQRDALRRALGWLRPDASPVLVQVPGTLLP